MRACLNHAHFRTRCKVWLTCIGWPAFWTCWQWSWQNAQRNHSGLSAKVYL